VLPAFLYMHIPSHEYLQYNPAVPESRSRCVGWMNDTVHPTKEDTGVFDAAVAAHIQYIFVGHMHGSDFCCPAPTRSSSASDPVMLCFGRRSGYGGYGKVWARGARMQRIDLSADRPTMRTWIRMEDGSIEQAG